jgi:radical SAM superfamily enzyme YgiQ (UPF0313 family)
MALAIFTVKLSQLPASIKFIPRHFARYGLPEDIFLTELKSRPRPDAILLTSFMTLLVHGTTASGGTLPCGVSWSPLVLGGIYASLMPDHAQRVIKPDYLITGPGEYPLAELLADILHMPSLREQFPAHIDSFPPPAFDLLRKNDYLVAMTSRGCPFRCTFCATYKVDSAFTQRQPEAVVAEILSQTERFGVQDVAFYDDALLMHLIVVSNRFFERLLPASGHCAFHTPNGLHARYIDEELADLMYRSGSRPSGSV